jgi:hypothetical protein
MPLRANILSPPGYTLEMAREQAILVHFGPEDMLRKPLRTNMFRWIATLVAFATAGAGTARDSGETSPAPVTFRNDVMAVLAKAGCSAGACHGNKSGKGGLKLSLRGQDPAADYETLTRELGGRRIDPFDPDASLLLRKATGAVPHDGGKRFDHESPEYGIFRRWIEAGTPRDDEQATPKLVSLDATPPEQVLVAPDSNVRLRVTAHFSDGSTRDVSRMAVYEQSADLAKIAPDGLVTRGRDGEEAVIVTYLNKQTVVRLSFVPERPGFVAKDVEPANVVDEHVFAKLRALRMNPSADCGDLTYLRRAYLDLLGVLPTTEEAQAFAADESSDKRQRLVESLLNRPEFAEQWAQKWADLLRVEERTLDRTGVEETFKWLKRSMAENKPIDRLAAELVSGVGSTYENPPANYYRALRDPVTRGEATAQVFLGTRLQCAQCHNHPFDRWTQDDYFGWADVFSRIDYKVLQNLRKDTNDGHEFVGEQVVVVKDAGAMKDPRTNKDVVAARFLGASDEVKGGEERLESLAAWMTRTDAFAKAQANRVWANLMGRGIVDPVDDFRASNPPTHPALLDHLAKEFASHGYDQRWLIKLIMASKTYALSSSPNDSNASDETNYSHAIARRLTAEQLLDAQHQALGVVPVFAGYEKGMPAGQIPGARIIGGGRGRRPTTDDMFLVTFGKPPRELSCDCERSNDTTLGQTFQLISGPSMSTLLGEKENRLGKMIEAKRSDEQIVRELYWSALTRPPTVDESSQMTSYVGRSGDRRKALEDVAWALLNAKEFVLRR